MVTFIKLVLLIVRTIRLVLEMINYHTICPCDGERFIPEIVKNIRLVPKMVTTIKLVLKYPRIIL